MGHTYTHTETHTRTTRTERVVLVRVVRVTPFLRPLGPWRMGMKGALGGATERRRCDIRRAGVYVLAFCLHSIYDRTQEIMLHFIQRGKRNDDNDDNDDAPQSRETAANDFYTRAQCDCAAGQSTAATTTAQLSGGRKTGGCGSAQLCDCVGGWP